ncbi:MAG: hypothetical protein M1817_005905 [Caeruleum heppii]|nr:MAG: hypothetical protein M1817_005905 [Caeruleum heppii]
MVLHNPNNWHWVNKDVAAWAKDYLDKNLTGITEEADGITARLEKVLSMDGDVDVSQRKNKVITLFDVKLQLEYSGSTPEEQDVGGTITIPEVAHDTQEDEYVFEIDIYSDASSKQPVKDLVRRQMVPELRKRLAQLGPALIAEHGKDIQHAVPAAFPNSNSTTSATSGGQATSGGSKAHSHSIPTGTTQGGAKGPAVNVTTVTDTEEFQTTAAELYQTFTDPQRLAAFTRAAPRLFEGAKKGGRFELFGGNVTGDFIELEEPKKLVQRWRLKQWPEGHYSTLQVTFDQNDQDAVTVMRVKWDGVPIGQEEVTKRNWREYYVVSDLELFSSLETHMAKITSCASEEHQNNFWVSQPFGAIL